MATRIRQGVTIFKNKNSTKDWFDEDSDFLILVKKTGYYNFTVDGKHYYYDQRIDTSKITNSLLVFAFNGGKKEEDKRKKKGKITIKKK